MEAKWKVNWFLEEINHRFPTGREGAVGGVVAPTKPVRREGIVEMN